MTHRFSIKFSGGEVLHLLADFTVVPVKFTASDVGLANRYPDEYRAWLEDIVAPEVARLSTVAQNLAAVAEGKRNKKKYENGN